jgi:hypothetical protein
MARRVVDEPEKVKQKCGKEMVKNKASATMNGGGVCPTVRAGFDSPRGTLQWRPKSRNLV